MGIMGFGWSLVSGLRRVPCPPAMMTAFIWSLRFASLRGVASRESGVWGPRLLGPTLRRSDDQPDSVTCVWAWLPRRAYLLPLPSPCLRSCFPSKSLH
jgi:hypothetical protein